MRKLRVLFICTQNSARSQMAEAFLRQFAGDTFEVESAGLSPAEAVNPLVVEAMAEVGVDLSGKRPQSVFDLFAAGRMFDYVITVCDKAAGEACPVFPGLVRRLHWPFPDPAKAEGSHAERMAETRRIRDMIRQRVERPEGAAFAEQDPFAS